MDTSSQNYSFVRLTKAENADVVDRKNSTELFFILKCQAPIFQLYRLLDPKMVEGDKLDGLFWCR